MHQFAWRFILRFGKRFSAGIERKSHFKEFHCDYMNQRRACVTGETAGLDVRKCIKGSQSKNDSSNTGSLPTHTLTDPTNTTTSFKYTTNTHTSFSQVESDEQKMRTNPVEQTWVQDSESSQQIGPRFIISTDERLCPTWELSFPSINRISVYIFRCLAP